MTQRPKVEDIVDARAKGKCYCCPARSSDDSNKSQGFVIWAASSYDI